MHGEVDPAEDARMCKVANLEHHVTPIARRLGAGREDVLDRSAGHQLDQPGGRCLLHREPGGDGDAVLEDGDPVTDLPDLLEPVGDVDDRHALGGQPADDPEQVLHLTLVEHGRRLVEDEQPGVVGERPGHAHDLLRGRREPPDRSGRRDLRVAQPLQQVTRLAVRAGSLAEPAAGDLVAEEDVLGDVELGDQVELLVDRRDAEPHRRDRGVQRGLLAVPHDGARVGLVGRGQHLDQRRLARAVLSKQAVHLAGADVEVDATEGPHARELLHDAAHLEQGPGPGTAVVGTAAVGRCHLAAPLRTVPAPLALVRGNSQSGVWPT